MSVVPTEESDMVRCRFQADHPGHTTNAVCRVSVPQGCACYPNDEEQDLCVQHLVSAEPLGDMEPTLIYQPEEFAELQRRGYFPKVIVEPDEDPRCDISGTCVAPKGAEGITNCIYCGKELHQKNGDWFTHDAEDHPYPCPQDQE